MGETRLFRSPSGHHFASPVLLPRHPVTGTRPITITKLEAAERQFCQAVKLHFGGGDPVSAHTLAAASCEVLRDLAKHRGVPHPFLDGILPLIPPEKRKEILRLFKKGQNLLDARTTKPLRRPRPRGYHPAGGVHESGDERRTSRSRTPRGASSRRSESLTASSANFVAA